MDEDGQCGRINCFALVSYLPEPLRGFLDGLRCELVPDYHAKAHVTVLPPRPLRGGPKESWAELRERLAEFPPFEVELGEVEIFPVTDVIYIGLVRGARELARMHAALNRGYVEWREPFEYHPHVTLAQQLESCGVETALERSTRKWREFTGSRSFEVRRLAFVQNTVENRWMDLEQFDLVGEQVGGLKPAAG